MIQFYIFLLFYFCCSHARGDDSGEGGSAADGGEGEYDELKGSILEPVSIPGKDMAKPGDIPYAVLVITNDTSCTGGLVTTSWVLSAAHCLVETGYTSNYRLYAGITMFTYFSGDPSAQLRFSEYVTAFPPRWDSLGNEIFVDLSMIKVNYPFKQTPYVKTVDIATHLPKGSSPCIAGGFGTGPPPVEMGFSMGWLQPIKVYAGKEYFCSPGARSFNKRRFNHDNVACVEYDKNEFTDFCGGDAGSLLVCDGKAVGLTSCGLFHCSSTENRTQSNDSAIWCSLEDLRGTYIVLEPYMEWIHLTSSDGIMSSLTSSLYCLIFILQMAYSH